LNEIEQQAIDQGMLLLLQLQETLDELLLSLQGEYTGPRVVVVEVIDISSEDSQ
jgi:hypothetical protein